MRDLDLYFDTKSIYWKKVLEIYDKNKDYPKKVVKNRNLHHIFPRSFSRKLKEKVDNSPENLVSLSLAEHFLVHYYYYKCARKGYKQSMSLAFMYMFRKYFRLNLLTDNIIEIMFHNLLIRYGT